MRKFVFGPGIDEPVILEDVAARYYYHADSLGSVIALSNDSGAYAETYAYSSWGQVVTGSSVGNPYLYTGRRLDSETGIYYYRNRYYDANLRRFLQADPIGFAGGMNLYAYVGNSPGNFVDPWGLQAEATQINPYEETNDPTKTSGTVIQIRIQPSFLVQSVIFFMALQNAIFSCNSSDGNGSGDSSQPTDITTPATPPDPNDRKNKSRKDKSQKNQKHGDGGRKASKIDKQLEKAKSDLENATTRKEKVQIKNKIKNLKREAERARKGQEDHLDKNKFLR